MKRVARYGAVGTAILGFNMGLAALAFRIPAFVESTARRNITNVVVTELALIFAFVLHRKITWKGTTETGWKKAFVMFHVVSSVGLLLRFGTFYLMDRTGFSPLTATLASIAFAIACNFVGYDRVVFRGASPTQL